MRISDWSSDVCSSDLHAPVGAASAAPTGIASATADARHRWITAWRAPRPLRRSSAPRPAVAQREPDRKSVVEGKSVSVRVDLGGRRIIKKKTMRERHLTKKAQHEEKNELQSRR